MSLIKKPKEIEILRAGGKILAAVVAAVAQAVKPGMTTADLNELAERLIAEYAGEPSFKGYKTSWAPSAFPAALCVSVNHEVVHGIPSQDKKIKTGDVIGIDCGLKYQGYFTDMATTVVVGKPSKQVAELLRITQNALMAGIEVIAPGKRISDISKAIEQTVKPSGFSIVRQLVGHGVGHAAHEEPQIPNYYDRYAPDMVLKPGMVLALEPMVNIGDWEVASLDDGWTIVTADSSLSAHFEHTVAVTETGYEILTEK